MSVISCQCGGATFPKQSKNLLHIVKKHTALDNRPAIEKSIKNSGETIECIYWQTSINEKRPKLKIWIDDVVIEGMVGTGVDVTIILSETLHPDWPLQDVKV